MFFTLLLVTGNTMAIAVRERTGELAVLKTVGFSDALRARPGAGGVAADRAAGRPAGRAGGHGHRAGPVPGAAGHDVLPADQCRCCWGSF